VCRRGEPSKGNVGWTKDGGIGRTYLAGRDLQMAHFPANRCHTSIPASAMPISVSRGRFGCPSGWLGRTIPRILYAKPAVALHLNRFWRTFGAGQPGENIFHRQRSPLIPLPVCLHKHPGVAKAYARLAPAVLFSIRLLPVRGVRQDQAHRGRTRAFSSVKPARPYIWRLIVLVG